MKFYDKLCAPAKLYLFISMVVYALILVQNLFDMNHFSLGPYSCAHNNCPMILLVQLVYIAFWTWLLQMICKINTSVSWAIVLFPFVLYFLLLFVLMVDGIRRER